MPIPAGSRAYIDTMIWIYHLVDPGHPLERVCERFLRDLENQKVKGLVSTFVLHEVVDVTKRLLAQKRNREPSQSDLDAIQERVEREMARLGVDIHDADSLAVDNTGQSVVFGRAGQLINQSGSFRGSHDGKWRTVNGADAIHVALAERAAASHYATFDEGFRRLTANLSSVLLGDVY